MVIASNPAYFQFIAEDSEINLLEKSNPIGAVTKEDIAEALHEYDQLFQIGKASKGELLTLHRAYPSNEVYKQAAIQKGLLDEDLPVVVVGGPASVEMVDREGHLITMAAMSKAFDKFMANERTRNVMVLHSDVQIGWALPAYINAAGQIFKSGVNDDRLFLLSEIRDDTKISERVIKQIQDGKLHSYSIAGSALSTQTIQKGMMQYMQVDELELAEVTVCEQGVNQGSNFDILKAEGLHRGPAHQTSTCLDGSCLVDLEKSDDMMDVLPIEPLELVMKSDEEVDFLETFSLYVKKMQAPVGTIATIMNEGGRREQHSHFLRELGFPEEVVESTMRDTNVEANMHPGHENWNADPSASPVVEPMSAKEVFGKKPQLVNEAGSEMKIFSTHDDEHIDSPNQVGMTKAISAFSEYMERRT